jgi:hypothetical protein
MTLHGWIGHVRVARSEHGLVDDLVSGGLIRDHQTVHGAHSVPLENREVLVGRRDRDRCGGAGVLPRVLVLAPVLAVAANLKPRIDRTAVNQRGVECVARLAERFRAGDEVAGLRLTECQPIGGRVADRRPLEIDGFHKKRIGKKSWLG